MRLHCKRCHHTHSEGEHIPVICVQRHCHGRVVWNPAPYRLLPMVYNPHRQARNRMRDPIRHCRVCKRSMRSPPKLWVHLVDGGMSIVHRDDSAELCADKARQPGDMGMQEVCQSCAKLFPPEFIIAWEGCAMPRTRTRRAVVERAKAAFG